MNQDMIMAVGRAAYVAAPGWATWLAYQGCRAVAVALFCMATE